MTKDIDVLFVCDYGQSRSPYFAKKVAQDSKGQTFTAFCGVEDWTPRVLGKLLKRAKKVVVLSQNAFNVITATQDMERLEMQLYAIEDEPAKLAGFYREWKDGQI